MTGKGRVTLPQVFAALVALYAVLEWGLHASEAAALAGIVAAVTGTVLVLRIVRRIVRASIWRLRNRLYVTYIFIGVVPIVLILTLAAIGSYIVGGQVAEYLVSSNLERRAESLAPPVRVLSEAKPSDRPAIVAQMGSFLASRMPGIQLEVSGDQSLHYPPDSKLEALPAGWSNYTGYILKDGAWYSAAIVKTGATTAMALAPIDREVLNSVVPGIGALRIGTDGPFAGTIPRRASGLEWLDFTTIWGNTIRVAPWDRPNAAETGELFVTTRPSAVLRILFSDGIEPAQIVTFIFAGVLCLFLAGEMVSLVIGISLTRTITQAVHGLYEGTQRIAKGDFAWRIPVKGKDQLAEVGRSFNNMTAQIENLVVIAKEKERLQSEVTIASEVQNQLFPHVAPGMRTIDLTGACTPARMCSGDYYDYLRMPGGNLALAIGDVAGKGISAALLMASIHSIIRTQIAAGMAQAAAVGGVSNGRGISTCEMVAQLNRQLHANTAPEKYATLFFGIYDEQSRVLTYTNAGHVQPLLLRGGRTHPLESSGTVVGLFPASCYEEKTVDLLPEDLLIAYTDGVTEPENAYGEEFGAGRLAEVALLHKNREPGEIVAKIMEAARHWSAAPELPDDMTVLIARGLA